MSTNSITSRRGIRGDTSYLAGRSRWWRALPTATKWAVLLAGAAITVLPCWAASLPPLLLRLLS